MSLWRPTSLSAAAAAAALLGSVATLIIVAGVDVISTEASGAEILGALLFMIYALIVMFVVASVLLLTLGIPLARIMRKYAGRTWMVPLSVLIGGTVGLLVVALSGGGMPRELNFSAALFGGVTGLFWLLLARPVLFRAGN